jgi:hypothetical protein
VDLAFGEQVVNLLEHVRLSPSNQKSVTFAIQYPGLTRAFQVEPNFFIQKPLADRAIESTLYCDHSVTSADVRLNIGQKRQKGSPTAKNLRCDRRRILRIASPVSTVRTRCLTYRKNKSHFLLGKQDASS